MSSGLKNIENTLLGYTQAHNNLLLLWSANVVTFWFSSFFVRNSLLQILQIQHFLSLLSYSGLKANLTTVDYSPNLDRQNIISSESISYEPSGLMTGS